jgi:ADP-ribose pyrophosphatase YjhB (NUDIX family)
MNVEVRAVIIHAERLVVRREHRFDGEHVALPGGRALSHETIEDSLMREVLEETGLSISVGRLLYVLQVVSRLDYEDLDLVFLAEPADAASLARLDQAHTIDLSSAQDVMPPLGDQIRRDFAQQWAGTPRWLGNLWDPQLRRTVPRPSDV